MTSGRLSLSDLILHLFVSFRVRVDLLPLPVAASISTHFHHVPESGTGQRALPSRSDPRLPHPLLRCWETLHRTSSERDPGQNYRTNTKTSFMKNVTMPIITDTFQSQSGAPRATTFLINTDTKNQSRAEPDRDAGGLTSSCRAGPAGAAAGAGRAPAAAAGT